ncbi:MULTISPECIES: Gfo/Idh/MocA family protein [Haloarcula]|uniref:Gfo/Idh/MocA-like oxidoreductase N-terminal domain-containing protein n=1 Tax=Haloarcula pellucida TaxID=1427151 RepID=A0A830GNH4_9EURY|nr:MULTISPECIES: Gfo/Idh/MocA family oxidoreductase [Halomicroarcula]MBX0349928.1 Gfo/Idh/MocA family oxidoreductase [Halomicroarcula pellucida]MDS0279676.1 Gfo/Idh/MocA family oxidoreductase [Halomicroarcula sp. S1AR25-4]GGN95041.1 hypothetical protein GCM10009030_22040 [Halomicroarcula pellucida]
MTLRTAVVGGGVVSETHLDGIVACPQTALVAVCDIEERRARAMAADNDAAVYTDYERMLDEADVEWVHLCTPVQTHLELALGAVERGIPVLIEKPITETVDEYERLASAAREYDVRVSAVHNHNLTPVMRALTRRVERGDVGQVRAVDHIHTGDTPPDAVMRGEWAFELLGGEFEEGLPHPLYILLRAGGYPRDESAIQVQTSCHREYDRDFGYDTVQLQYVSQDDVQCSATLMGGGIPNKVVYVHGEEGTLVADIVSQTLVSLDRDYSGSSIGRALNNLDRAGDRVWGTAQNARAVAERAAFGEWPIQKELNEHYYQFDEEASAILNDDPMPIPLTEAGWTMRLLESIRDAATEGPAVATPTPED